MKFMKNIKERLDAPVPLFWRRLGSAFTAAGAIEVTTDMAGANPWLHKAILISAFVGALLTNFAKEN
jgi:hypothetical protein